MRIDLEKNKELNELVPKELVEHYAKEVNKSYVTRVRLEDFNIEYEYDEESELIRNISPFTFNMNFKIPSNMLSEVKSIKDFEKYLHNSQTEIELDKNDIPFVKVDGEEIPVDNLFLKKNGEPVKTMKMGVTPVPFAKNDKIILNLKVPLTEEREVILNRKANNSVETILYENDEQSDLFIFSIKINGGEVQFSIVSKLSAPTTIDNIIFVKKLLLAFHQKKLEINGVNMRTLFQDEDSITELDEEEISMEITMWENVKKLESILKKEFVVKLPLTHEEVNQINELMVSLILNKPFKDHIKINSINLDISSLEELESHEEEFKTMKSSKKSMVIGGQMEREIKLFGITLKLFEIYQIYNVIVIDVKTHPADKKIEIFLEKSTKETSHVTRKYNLQKEGLEKLEEEFKEARYIEQYNEELLEKLRELE